MINFELPSGYDNRLRVFRDQGLDLEVRARQASGWWQTLSAQQKRSRWNQDKRQAEERSRLRFRGMLKLLRLIPKTARAWVECDWNKHCALGIYWMIRRRPFVTKGSVRFVFCQDEWRS